LRDLYHNKHAGFKDYFDRYGLNEVDLKHQRAAFMELVAEFDKLRWYGRVNTDGFRKIVYKIRSLGTNGVHNAAQVEETLCRLEFATQGQGLGPLMILNKGIALITRTQQNLPKVPLQFQDSFCIQLAKFNSSIPARLFCRVVENDDSLELGKADRQHLQGRLGFLTHRILSRPLSMPHTIFLPLGWMS